MAIYQVAVLNTAHDFFDYTHPKPDIAPGSRVWVPFRQQLRLGIVLSSNPSETQALKTIDTILDPLPLIPTYLLDLAYWMSRYYQAPLNQVLALMLPKPYRQGKCHDLLYRAHYQMALSIEQALDRVGPKAHKQRALLSILAQHHRPMSRLSLQDKGYSSAIISGLMSQGLIRQEMRPLEPITLDFKKELPLTLNTEQELAYQTIVNALERYHCFLLFGVTGSGKTEVYFQLISQVLSRGRQVLILVPEIGLTPQLKQRFQARFAESMVVIHSHMNDSERLQAWLWAQEGKVQLVLGTRSALFTPMPSLGLIVIDEEHDSSFKQMDGVRYLARDTALMRAHAANIPVILGSATPSLESLHNVDKGKYTLLRLSQKAMNTLPLRYEIVDLRAQPMVQGLASRSIELIKQHLDLQQQVLIFLNRRGFSPVLFCHRCAWKAGCKACDSHLTVHKNAKKLICHHCGYAQVLPELCPDCHSPELIHLGVGTQRIEDLLRQHFPKTNILRIDRDAVRKKNELDQSLEEIHSGKAELIIGTQLLAKGHHFPKLSLVVILEADQGFYNHDFRALERLGQLLTQVSGRAGRANLKGEVLIQTHLPEHPLLNCLLQQGYEPFAQALLEQRLQAALPPYSFMALLTIQGKRQDRILALMQSAKTFLSPERISIFGPAPAPMAKKAYDHRFQLMIKSNSRQCLQAQLALLRAGLMADKRANALRWSIDVDPIDLS